MADPRTRPAALVLALVAALFGWWGWKQGAYFGGVFYPGALATFLLLALLLATAPFAARFSGSAKVALVVLMALSAWELASVLWSPIPADAVKYAWHDFLYVAIFAIGVWATHLLRGRMIAALAPVAGAVAAAGLATVVVLASGHDVSWYLHSDATLRFPVGYRNADAAFFLIGLWPLLALIAGNWDWRLRVLLAGAGTILIELAFLAQSRGSIPALALAVIVFLLASRDRLRATMAIALVLLPALLAFPTLLDVYHYGRADPAVIPLLRSSARAIGLTGLLSLLLAGLAFGVAAPRLRLGANARLAISRSLATVAFVAVVVGAVAFVSQHGGPVGFVDQRVKEFDRVGYPDLHGQGVRYGANIGSNRHDFWRVAIDEGASKPLSGGGGGAFQIDYLQHRRSDETPEDPHSVEALMFSELGIPGLALFFAFIIGTVAAALRSRRLGPAAAGLTAGALAAGAQWFAQSSYDWLWNYPGVTAPAIFLLGAAAAPALLYPAAHFAGRLRAFAAVALVALTLLGVPLYLSARYVERAYGETRLDPRLAIADFGSAADLNPLDAEPLLARGTVQADLGETTASLASLRAAIDREPEAFMPHYLIAQELAPTDPTAARVALRRARELNPKDPDVAALWRRLARSE